MNLGRDLSRRAWQKDSLTEYLRKTFPKMNEKHIGSDFDDFLAEEGILIVVESFAIKRAAIYQATQPTKEQDFSQSERRNNA